METKDLQRKIRHLVDILVILPADQRKRILQSLDILNVEELSKLEAVLDKAYEGQQELLREGFKKDPLFAQKFTSFQEVQMQKAQSEAVNFKNRDFMKDYLNFKAEWRKKT